jgi:hypothetical protein
LFLHLSLSFELHIFLSWWFSACFVCFILHMILVFYLEDFNLPSTTHCFLIYVRQSVWTLKDCEIKAMNENRATEEWTRLGDAWRLDSSGRKTESCLDKKLELLKCTLRGLKMKFKLKSYSLRYNI